MSDQPQDPDRLDITVSRNPQRVEQEGDEQVEQAPAGVLRGYPPEASPAPDDSTEPVQVVGEQTDPARRAEVFPEDADGTGSDRAGQ